uniref:Tetratricopeptide repeat domain 21A n=1 Tax=Latimeria chalumnae TaxID=7897 RepID=H3ARN0_LATCH
VRSGTSKLKAAITYYCQEKYYHHMQDVANEGLKKYTNDPVLLFFRAFGFLVEDRTQEAIRELEAIKDNVDISLCCILALIYAHRKSETVDRDAVLQLEGRLKESRKTAGDKALYYAAMFLWLLGRNIKAKEYIDRMLKISNSCSQGLILKGWVDLTSDKELAVKKSLKYLEEGVQDSKDMFGLMGKVKYFMMQQSYAGALEVVNQIVVALPSFFPALILKMKLFLAQQDLEQALEVTHRILQRDGTNIDALLMLTVHSLSREGNMKKVGILRDHHTSCLCSCFHCAGCSVVKLFFFPFVLGHQVGFIIKLFLNPLPNPDWPSYLQRIRLFIENTNLKRYLIHYAFFLMCVRIWPAILIALLLILLYPYHSLTYQVTILFLKDVEFFVGPPSAHLQVSCVLKKKEVLYSNAFGCYPQETNNIFHLNNASCVCVCEYICNTEREPRAPGESVSPMLKHSAMILDPVLKASPSNAEALYLMAKTKYLSVGELESVSNILQRYLELDPSSANAHLLMAQVHLSQGNVKQCSQSLELGVSHNFQVREHPLYHLIKARALKKLGAITEAIKTLRMVMSLPGMRKSGTRGKVRGTSAAINTSDRVSVYLELAEALRLNGEQHEATKVIQDAINEFTGTPEEIRITIANVDLALYKEDVDTALSMLRNIQPNNPYYAEARQKMAHIYLHKRKDKRLYIGSYRELYEHMPSPHTSLLLGDAYMNVQEPEKAIEVYEQALKKNPKDATLASKIGQALVKTHQYSKAINYYEAALKISRQDILCYDLADLLLKLKQFDKAEKVLKQVLEHDFVVNDLPAMMNDIKYLMLLAKVHSNRNKTEDALNALNKAYELQTRVLKRLPLEQPEIIPAQKQSASLICSQFAQQCVEKKDYEKAARYYKEALVHSEANSELMLELAQLYMTQGDLDSCEHQCSMILNNDQDNEKAAMMMAGLLFRKQEYEQAILHYRQLLTKVPDNFSVLASLIDLLRRAGKLDEAPAILEMIAKKTSRSVLEPGYNYCKGLYFWHMGQTNEALKHFNKSRKDSDWGQNAIYNMIQICLNPDNDTIGGEVFENLEEGSSSSSTEKQESEQLAIRTAEKLLKEFHPTSKWGQEQLSLMQNSCLMATKEKLNVEMALTAFTEMASAEKDHVPSLLAMAQAYMILKQTPKARNQLKRITKMNWSMTEAEELEKSWLLLADIYIKAGKYDIAIDLLKRCLQYNKSCCKAYEYLGFMMEKEQSYKDAATNYEMAWKYSNQANPAIGFKLAFNYLKAKRYIETIDVCHKVLNDYPSYPKIKNEILEKAQGSLRP